MPNWKKVIISGSDAALNSLEITSHLTASGLIYPTADGTNGQAITTDAAGNLTFGNPGFADEAEKVTFEVQNGDTSTLAKGTPVHITSMTGGTAIVVAASASVASKMPSHGILNQQLTVGSDGFATILGQITGVDTSAFSPGDTVYVGPFGGYTNVKPTGSTNLIQNLGVVKKVDASNGTGEIFGSGRTNDVPNLPTGKIWVGDSYTVTSSVVHLDEPNGRLGLGTASPTDKLDIVNTTSTLLGLNYGSNQMRFAIDNRSHIKWTGSSGTLYLSGRGNGLFIGGTSSDASARLHVKGSGTTSATTALLVEDSSGSDLLEVNDQGNVTIPNGSLSLNGATDTETFNILGNMTFDGGGTISGGGVGDSLDLGAAGANISVGGANSNIVMTGGVSGSFSGSFEGDGTNLTGITAEWDGSHNGDAEITGSLIVSGSGVDLTVEGDVNITDGNRLNIKSAGGTYTGYIEKDTYDATVNLGLNTTFTGARRIYINDGTNQRWEFGGSTTGASDNIIAPGGGYSGSAVYAGHAGSIGFFTRASTVAADVMQLFDRTDNNNHGVKLIYKSGGSYSDGLMLDNTGNVGIGTTSPTGRNGFVGQKVFELYNASSYASLNVTGNGSTFGTLGAQTSGVDLRSSGPLRLATNGNNTRMTLDSSGNVGIGTTSPSQKLDVDGNAVISGSLELYNGSLLVSGSTDSTLIGTDGEIELGYDAQPVRLNRNKYVLVNSGPDVVATVDSNTFLSAHFDYVIIKGTNLRAGTVMACHDGSSNVVFTETATSDLGSTAGVTLDVVESGGTLELQMTVPSTGWFIKTFVRAI